MVSLPFLLQRSAFTVKGTAHIITLPVSKMLLEALRERELKSPVPKCYGDRKDDFTQSSASFSLRRNILAEVLFLTTTHWRDFTSQSKNTASEEKINNIYFYNLFDRIQIGNRFVCCDNVC